MNKYVSLRFHNMQAKTVFIENGPNVTFFVSYTTPVAYRAEDGSFVVTTQTCSVTTTKQLNRWLRENGITKTEKISQAEMDQRYNSFQGWY